MSVKKEDKHMADNKVISNPGFTQDDGSEVEVKKTPKPEVEEEDKGEDGEKQADDSSEEEDDTSAESPSGEKQEDAGEKSDEEKEKERELQGLLNQERELGTEDSELDQKIQAARDRIKVLRANRREKRDVLSTVDKVSPEEDGQDDLSDIDPESLKIIDRVIKAKGLVPKSELKNMQYSDAHKASESNFYKTHPEYLPENDTNDDLYKALKKELSFYAKPSDPSLIPELFERAHKIVQSQFPDKFKAPKNPAEIAAKQQKKSIASMGGGNSGNSSTPEKKSGKSLTDAQIQILRDGGWSEEDIKDLNN